MTPRRYRFLACTADTAARELRRDGELVELSPKVFDCLIHLIENRERAVSRDELINAVWGRTNVSDTQLGQTVLRARRAVGDTGNEQTAIRTVPRFGYRWVAEISIDIAPAAAMPEANTPDPTSLAASDDAAETVPMPSPHRESPRRIGLLPVAGALALLVAAIAAYRWRSETPPAADQTAPAAAATGASAAAADGALAVLPVAHSAGNDWFWLRLGLMDQIDRRLQLAGQAVVPSSNIVALANAAPATETTPEAKVLAATGARYIVQPQATRTPNGWRVQLDLREGGQSRRLVEGSGSDVVVAANAAADRLLLALGKAPPAEPDPATLPLEQLLQRTDAVLLGSDFDGARRLIATAAPALRDQPAAQLMLARIDGRAGDLAAARTRLETLLRDIPTERDPALRARGLYALGVAKVREDRSEEAIPLFSEALALRLRDNRPAELGEVYTGFAGALINLGRYAEAGDALARARAARSGRRHARARARGR